MKFVLFFIIYIFHSLKFFHILLKGVNKISGSGISISTCSCYYHFILYRSWITLPIFRKLISEPKKAGKLFQSVLTSLGELISDIKIASHHQSP